jgi:hypothetical protein
MVEISPPTELADWIGGGFMSWWKILYASNNGTSTDFILILSTNYSMVVFAASTLDPTRGGPLADGRAFVHTLKRMAELPEVGKIQA